MKRFAIVVIAYNRDRSLNLLLSSISHADYEGDTVDLFISCDLSNNSKVVEIANNFEWIHGRKTIVKHNEKLGLKKHVLKCFEFCEEYDAAFFLEDDLVVSNLFYIYGKQAAEFYDNEDRIAGISLYSLQKNWLNWCLRFEPQKTQYDTFFIKLGQSWGQLFTKKQWMRFKKWLSCNPIFIKDENNPDNINTWPDSSWLKFLDRYCIMNNYYFVYPYYGVSTNTSACGEHNYQIQVSDYQCELLSGNKRVFTFPSLNENLDCVKYDEYLNRIGLEQALNIQKDNLQIDLWGTKKSFLNKAEYYLTTKKIKNCELIKSFELSFRPIEFSIINDIKGEGIYLYKINNNKIKPRKRLNVKLLRYTFRISNVKGVFALSWNLFFLSIYRKVCGAFRKIWKIQK